MIDQVLDRKVYTLIFGRMIELFWFVMDAAFSLKGNTILTVNVHDRVLLFIDSSKPAQHVQIWAPRDVMMVLLKLIVMYYRDITATPRHVVEPKSNRIVFDVLDPIDLKRTLCRIVVYVPDDLGDVASLLAPSIGADCLNYIT
jgi:hypothetical protein